LGSNHEPCVVSHNIAGADPWSGAPWNRGLRTSCNGDSGAAEGKSCFLASKLSRSSFLTSKVSLQSALFHAVRRHQRTILATRLVEPQLIDLVWLLLLLLLLLFTLVLNSKPSRTVPTPRGTFVMRSASESSEVLPMDPWSLRAVRWRSLCRYL